MNKIICSLLISLLLLQQIKTKEFLSLRLLQTSSVIDVTDASFQTDVLNNTKPSFVLFMTDWCESGKTVSDIFDEFSSDDKFVDKAQFMRMNIDAQPNTALLYNIIKIPTIIVFVGGEQVDTILGVHTIDVFDSLFMSYL